MAKNAANATAADAPKSFEAALAELEKIVQSMEAGTLPLEQSLAAHKRGIELARFCQARLAQAQAQVRVLEDEALKALSGDDAEG
jgi:exodeoxyribonuclease VII small subunit